MKANYHTHTFRCGHAQGSDEQYVLAAIEAGFETLGFSDHIPFRGVHAPKDRMDFDQMDDYLNSIQALKKTYASKIKILVGFEMEYYPELLEYYKEIRSKVDYLIVGQHYKALNYYGYDMFNTDADLEVYTSQVCEAMDSGLVSILAHPEYFMLGRKVWNEACEKTAHAIAQCAAKNNVFLEINLNGLRFGKQHTNLGEHFPYPFMPFWDIVAQYPVKCCYGLDAHRPLTLLESHRIDLFHKTLMDKGLTIDLNPQL